jgi:hypothetical protein
LNDFLRNENRSGSPKFVARFSGFVVSRGETKNAYRVLVRKPKRKKTLGRHMRI